MKIVAQVLAYSLFFLSLGGAARAQQLGSDIPYLYRGDAARTGVADVSGLPEFSAIKWQASGGRSLVSTPFLVNGVLYVGLPDTDQLRAFDAGTGDVRWTADGIGALIAPVAVEDGVVYGGGLDKTLYALDAETGSVLWSFTAGGGIWGAPLLADGLIYFGDESGTFYALDTSTQEERWRHECGHRIVMTPAMSEGMIYFSCEETLYALDAATGDEQWSRAGVWWYHAAIMDGVVYAGDSDSRFYALDAATGDEKWSFEAGSAPGLRLLSAMGWSTSAIEISICTRWMPMMGTCSGHFPLKTGRYPTRCWRAACFTSALATT